MPFDDSIGVGDDESGPYICKDLVFTISIDDVSQDLRLVEDIHFAHILIDLSFGHLKSIFLFGNDCDFSFGRFGFIFYLFVVDGSAGSGFKEGHSKLFIGWS